MMWGRNFMDMVNDGSTDITADNFPAFLYESDAEYNPDMEYVGLFRGYLLPRVCFFLSSCHPSAEQIPLQVY